MRGRPGDGEPRPDGARRAPRRWTRPRPTCWPRRLRRLPLREPRRPRACSFSLPRIVTGGKQGKEPMYFEADHLEGEAGERTRATGKVRLRQG